MNEISPTANAAKIVVSTLLDTSELVALEIGVEARRVPAAGRGRRGRRAAPAPAQGGRSDGGERDEYGERGDHVGAQVEPLSRRKRKHPVAELLHERRLDL